MASKKEIRVSPRVEEILIGSAVGAGLGLALVAPFVSGLPGYLPHDVTTLVESIRAGLAWVAPTVGALAGGYYTAVQPRDTHLSGMLYIPRYREARRTLQAIERAAFNPPQRGRAVRGITIGGVEISAERATQHFQCIGQTGQGKTTLYSGIVDQVLAQGGRIVIHDIKGDLIRRYYDPKTVMIAGPWDARAFVWDAPADFADPTAVTEFATAVMEVTAVKQGGKDAHWVEGAAAVLAGVIRSYLRSGGADRWSWAGLLEDLHVDPLALVQKAARGNEGVRRRFSTAFLPVTDKTAPFLNREGASMVGSIEDGIAGWLEEMAVIDAKDTDRPRFSFSRWLTGEAHQSVRMVIFNYAKEYETPARRLFGAMFGVMSKVLASGRVPGVPADTIGTWFILDEVVQMGAGVLRECGALMALGRSKGARVMMAFQSASQVADAMGPVPAKAVLDQAVTPIYMHPSTPAAKEIADALGKHQLDRIQTNASNGAVPGKTKVAVDEPVITTGDVESLGRVSTGIELIVQIKDRLGRLVQPFPAKRESDTPLYVESETWKWGALRALEEADKRRAAEAASATAPPPATLSAPAVPPPALNDTGDMVNEDDLTFDDLTLDDPGEDTEA